MSKAPFFSIVMPVYNVEKYLGGAIESILQQTFTDLELILVDDGSTDSSHLIATQYRQTDVRVKVVQQANGGLSAARNTGLDHARGTYVYFIDSDDLLDKTALQHVYTLLAENAQPEVVAFNARPFLDDEYQINEGESLLQAYSQPYEQNYLADGLYSGRELYLKRTTRDNFLPSAWLFVIKTNFLQEAGLRFVDGLLHEDEVFSRYLFIHAKSVYLTHEKFYQYRLRKGSIMQVEVSRHRVMSLIAVAEAVYALYEKEDLPELKQDALRFYNEAFRFYERHFPGDPNLANRLAASTIFVHDLHTSTLIGQEFEMQVPSSMPHPYTDQPYQPLTARMIANYIVEDSLFVDLGAGHGYFSLLAASQSKAKQIISVESDPLAFKILSKNIDLNQFKNIVLSNRDILKHTEEHDTVDYLDTVIAANHASGLFFKISAGGRELAVLNDLKQIINRTPGVRFIVECHPKMMKQAGYEPGTLFDFLFTLDVSVFVIDETRQVLRKLDAHHPDAATNELSDAGGEAAKFSLLCLPATSPASILLFSHSSYLAGAERSLQTLLSDFPREGKVATVVLPSDGPLKSYLEKNGAATVIHPYTWWSDQYPLEHTESLARLARDYRTVQEDLVPKLRQINPDVVVTNTSVIPWGAISAFLMHKPHLWYVHELGLPEHGITFFYPRERVTEYIKGSSNLVVTNSLFTNKSFFGESVPSSVEVIYPVGNLNKTRSSAVENFFHQPDSFKLAFIGGIVPGRGQLDAIYALNELIATGEKVELVFAGATGSEYYQMLLDKIEQFNLAPFARFAGFIEHPYDLYQQADAILNCSRNEAFGLVTLEAMELGKPIVAAASGGTLELIEDNVEGLLYPPGDIIKLTEQIKRLIDQPGIRTRLGDKAASKARMRFSREITLKKFHEILRRVAVETNQTSQDYFYWIMDLEHKDRSMRLVEKDAQLAAKDAQLAAKDAQLAAQDAQLAAQDAQLAAQDAQLALRDAQIMAIYSSRTWKLGAWLHRIRVWVAPPGSRRAQIGNVIYSAGIKIIRKSRTMN